MSLNKTALKALVYAAGSATYNELFRYAIISRNKEELAKMRKTLAIAILCVFAGCGLLAQTNALKPSEAKDHVGEHAIVCGKVVSGHFAQRSKGQPTFLNLDEPYPRQIFTIVIWGSDRAKFGTPETKYDNNRVCITGKITTYRNEPEVTATSPDQIVIQK